MPGDTHPPPTVGIRPAASPRPAPPRFALRTDPRAEAAFWAALEDLHPGAGGLLEQVCAHAFAADPSLYELVATPRHKAAAADGPFLRWAVVVRSDAPAQALNDLRGLRLAVADGDLDGATLLRADVAYLAGGAAFFEAVTPFADLPAQLAAVRDGTAHAALLDGVAWAGLSPQRSNLVRYRLLHWTPRAPAPPFVVRALTPAADVRPLAEALDRLADDPLTRRTILAPLGIDRFHRLPKAQYRALTHYDQIASSQGYDRLR